MESSAASDQPGLPPVLPPSGRHIVQMFVVPGLIVAVVVVLFLGCSGFWGWLFGLSSTPQQDLSRLESPNPDIRWRAANNLAQVLKRDNALACDPAFGLKLVQILAQELDRLDEQSQVLKEKGPTLSKEALQQQLAELRTRRETVRYLSACLGNMSVPVGVPLLQRMATQPTSYDEKTSVLLRRHAVWMLANLGENMKRLKQEDQAGVRERFQAAVPDDARTGQARDLVLKYYAPRSDFQSMHNLPELGVIDTLADCSRSDDIFLREMVALALSIWPGSTREQQVAEQTLIRLSQDPGFGRRIEIGEND
jgi:hypothetical protein